MSSAIARRRLRIAVFHPELTVGGAERVMIDAARAFQDMGHEVTLFTVRLDRSHCLEETAGRSLNVQVLGGVLPSHLAQHMRAPCAVLRMAYLAAAGLARNGPFDVLFCDQVPHVVPLMKRLSPAAAVIFYCHFPDPLLARQGSRLYAVYRRTVDRLGQSGIRLADAILVNSQFTADALHATAPPAWAGPVRVIRPSVDLARYAAVDYPTNAAEILLLSLNRFKQEKNHPLAIRALFALRRRIPAEVFAKTRLVVAGGFDPASSSDRRTLEHLRQMARRMDLESHVTFQPSCSEADRRQFLGGCRCLIYTPENEHFGLGIIEAMAAGRPVVAVASGGPLETVRHGETGLLCEATEESFAAAIERLIMNETEARQMGQAGKRRVMNHFSFEVFRENLSEVLDSLIPPAASQTRGGAA